MFDFAWSEIGLIGLVAVLVLGPKELPQAMRTLGRFTRRARKLANEFQGQFDEMVREAELDDVRNTVQRIAAPNVGAEIDKLLDPDGQLGAELDTALAKARETAGVPATEAPAGANPPPLPPATPVASPAQTTIPADHAEHASPEAAP